MPKPGPGGRGRLPSRGRPNFPADGNSQWEIMRGETGNQTSCVLRGGNALDFMTERHESALKALQLAIEIEERAPAQGT